jgi:glycerophosphoryl diester phosphodiesterase
MTRSCIRTAALSNNSSLLVMAHRGGEGVWPSNTLYAFERALAMGAEVLEMDIQRTADGALVIRHDPTVDSTTNGRGAIASFSLADLKKLDAGYTWTGDGGQTFPYRRLGITIPTLEEVLQAFPQARLNIDIKPTRPDIVDQFCQMLRAYNRLEQVVVGSFHTHQIRRFRALCPQTPTAADPGETRVFYLLSLLGLSRFYRPPAAAFQIPEYAGWLHIVTPHFIRSAHAQGLQVHVWTVNEVEDMRRLREWGVDGLFTDYPERLIQLLK